MRFRIAGLSLLILLASSVVADEAANPFARDILMVTDWFEGEFDNEEQIWFHGRSRAEGEPAVRVHVSNVRVDLSEFGEHVFYVEEYRDNDPENVYRQRLVIFSSDLEEGAIRMQQGIFKEPVRVLGGTQDTSKLDGLSQNDVSFLSECDVFLRRVADQFHGGMAPKRCVFGDGDERRYAVHDIVLSEAKLWRTDATYLTADDSFFRGTLPGVPTELRRAKVFFCDYYFDLEGGGQQVEEGLRVHSQGGNASVVRESDGQVFEILIREKEYNYYETRPDFLYYSIRRAGERRSVAYGVTDSNARQFGTKAGNVGAFCHRQGYTFQEPVESL